jgi:hypothetical protein
MTVENLKIMTGGRFLLILIFTILFIFLWEFIDFEIITPLLPLPDDICFTMIIHCQYG